MAGLLILQVPRSALETPGYLLPSKGRVFTSFAFGGLAISVCCFALSFQESGRACRKLETIRSLLVDGALRSQPTEKLTIARRIRRKSYLVAARTDFAAGSHFGHEAQAATFPVEDVGNAVPQFSRKLALWSLRELSFTIHLGSIGN